MSFFTLERLQVQQICCVRRVCYTVPGTAEAESGFKDSRPTMIPYQIYIQHPNIRFQDRTLRCFRWR